MLISARVIAIADRLLGTRETPTREADATVRHPLQFRKDRRRRGYRVNAFMEPEREYDRLQTLEWLVREAHDVMTNPESRVDLRDWARSAERVLWPDVVQVTRDEDR